MRNLMKTHRNLIRIESLHQIKHKSEYTPGKKKFLKYLVGLQFLWFSLCLIASFCPLQLQSVFCPSLRVTLLGLKQNAMKSPHFSFFCIYQVYKKKLPFSKINNSINIS